MSYREDCRPEDYEWSHPKTITLLMALPLLDIIVVVGNIIVIAVVRKSDVSQSKHSVVNMFIITLAIADLMIGLLVLPFSFNIALKFWIFGNFMCTLWRLIVIWTCSTSIWNLCAISVVRCIAATKPVKYNLIVTRLRAKILIAAIWILTFAISFPPIVIWDKNNTCEYHCEIAGDLGHRLYIVTCSFVIPTFVMIFCYWKIYNVAAKTEESHEMGYRKAKKKPGNGISHDLTLRIHRGRSSEPPSNPTSPTSPTNNNIFIISKPVQNKTVENSNNKISFDCSINTPSTSSSNGHLVTHSTSNLYRKNSPIERKAGKTVSVIVGTYIICWVPFVLTYILSATGWFKVSSTVFNLSAFCGLCNSAMNPAICMIFFKDFKDIFMKMFRQLICCCNTHSSVRSP